MDSAKAKASGSKSTSDSAAIHHISTKVGVHKWPKLKLTSRKWMEVGRLMSFLGWHIFRCYFSFREGNTYKWSYGPLLINWSGPTLYPRWKLTVCPLKIDGWKMILSFWECGSLLRRHSLFFWGVYNIGTCKVMVCWLQMDCGWVGYLKVSISTSWCSSMIGVLAKDHPNGRNCVESTGFIFDSQVATSKNVAHEKTKIHQRVRTQNTEFQIWVSSRLINCIKLFRFASSRTDNPYE